MLKKQWVVYILKCVDETLYTGITNDLEKRIAVHGSGKGAKYTRGRLPVELLKFFEVENRSAASKLEIKIKKMSRKEKLAL